MAEFADAALLRVTGGNGGHGCASIRREKFKPLGGPDGGNGGRGGDVILEVDPGMATLLDFHRRPVRRGGNGRSGAGSNRSGAEGSNLVIGVPEGTVVKTASGEVLADLIGAGTRFVAAAGGKGGLGNAALASPRRKAPGFALKGEPGDEHELVLELKSIADVGLVGFPSAGKSSLIAAMSAARPKIADYPFTTLVPNLGVAEAGDVQFVIADVPGLIPGASLGKGLGLEFLRHIERCAALVHVIDCATEEPGREPLADLGVIEAELAAYQDVTGAELASRPRLVALNKIDVPAARERARPGQSDPHRPGPAGLRGLRRDARGAARARLRHGRAGHRRPRRRAAAAAHPPGHPARAGRRARLRGHPDSGGGVPDPGRETAPVGAADRLQQRRGRRIPRRPAGAAGGGGRAWRSGRRTGRRDPHRRPGRPGGVRLGPHGTDGHRPRPARQRPQAARMTRPARAGIAAARRIVVKVGSSSLTTADGSIDDDRIVALADSLAERAGAGTHLVLVSSGAIAAGIAPLGLPSRPRDLATQQAAASVGQGLLIARYAAAFARHGMRTGQVLLSADDLMRRAHYRNAQRTLDRLLDLGVLPIVNENNTVATDEIRFGDNDRLAALVAHVTRAGALILLSDVDGLYDEDPRRPGARRITEVRSRADLDGIRIGRSHGTGPGTGGMATKVDSAMIATGAGIPTVVASAAGAAAALAGERPAPISRPPAAGRERGCSGSRTPPGPAAGCGWTAAPWRPSWRGARPCCPPGSPASRARSTRATRSTCVTATATSSRAAWSATTPARSPG